MGKRRFRFKWIEWNLAKVASHGITAAEAEEVIRGNPDVAVGHSGAFVARGRTAAGRYLEVVFVWDEALEAEDAIGTPAEAVVFVITAYDMTNKRKRAHRRRRRR